MNDDRSKEKWVQFIGELQNQSGKLAKTVLHELGGNYHKFVGRLRKRYGDKVRVAIRTV
ncbi:MAG: CsbD family protein [Nitrospira sp.]